MPHRPLCNLSIHRQNNGAVTSNEAGKNNTPRPRSASPLPLRRAPVCAALLRCLGGFGGGLGVTPPRRSHALYGGQILLKKVLITQHRNSAYTGLWCCFVQGSGTVCSRSEHGTPTTGDNSYPNTFRDHTVLPEPAVPRRSTGTSATASLARGSRRPEAQRAACRGRFGRDLGGGLVVVIFAQEQLPVPAAQPLHRRPQGPGQRCRWSPTPGAAHRTDTPLDPARRRGWGR